MYAKHQSTCEMQGFAGQKSKHYHPKG